MHRRIITTVRQILALAAAGALAASCQRGGLHGTASGGSLNKDRLRKLSQDEPATKIDGGLLAAREAYQTRSTVVIKLSDTLAGAGQSISLVNDTTGAILIDQEPLAFGGSLTEGFAVAASPSGAEVILKIYPILQTQTGNLAYGANQLRTVVRDAQGEKFAENAISIGDFNVMGPSVLAFDGEVETGGYRLELSQNSLMKPVVNEQSVPVTQSRGALSNEVFNIINEWAPQVL